MKKIFVDSSIIIEYQKENTEADLLFKQQNIEEFEVKPIKHNLYSI